MNARVGSVFPFTAAIALALAACESPTSPTGIAELGAPVAMAPGDRPMVGQPFAADFFTNLAGFAPGPECQEGQLVNTQVGEGTSTLMGKISLYLTFCVNLADLGVLADGQLTEGESLPYSDGTGVITAANGDELYIEIAGEILPSENPNYDFQFADPFALVGGTGRFEGASGEGMTDSLVDFAGGRTDHRWRGLLIVRPGR